MTPAGCAHHARPSGHRPLRGITSPRENLLFRRFIRNRPAVVALILLVLLFVGCYGLPPLLPYDYTALDYHALLQPPSIEHWFGTNALGQDLLARTLRGMQKSMLIGFCVALISTSIAATVGSVAGYFGGWRDRALMWLVDLLLVVPGFMMIAIITPRIKQSSSMLWLIVLLAVIRLDGQLADGARPDDEPARTRIRPSGKVYGGVQTAA